MRRKSCDLALALLMCLFFCVVAVPAAFAYVPMWTKPVPVAEVNLDGVEEWSPFLSYDGLTLYFARMRASHFYEGRLFQATRSEPHGPFTQVEELPGPLNASVGDVLHPWVSPDNLRMYYYVQVGARFMLMVTERDSFEAGWPQGTSIAELNALDSRILMPRLTADELIIVFSASETAGGYGGYDLWMAQRADRQSPFTNIQNIEAVNSSSSELGPHISADGLQLYFSSNRNERKQLFVSERATRDEPFGAPVCLSMLDMPGGHNAQPCLSSDGLSLYFQLQTGENRSTRDIYVSYAVPAYYVDVATGDDWNDGRGPATAFATIQRAIDVAQDGDVVNVYPGLYREPLFFQGKAITVQSVGAAAVLETPGRFAVSFYMGEGPDTVLRNFVIANSYVGIIVTDSSPTLTNLTVTGNELGIEAYRGANPHISNSIFWGNLASDLYGCSATYSCIERGADGEGNFSDDPLFVDPARGDYHLRSERGRYWPEHDVWVLDNVTSPCIDAGDPNDDFSREPLPNGGRVNVGAFGGTPFASRSPDCPPGQASNPNPADNAVPYHTRTKLTW